MTGLSKGPAAVACSESRAARTRLLRACRDSWAGRGQDADAQGCTGWMGWGATIPRILSMPVGRSPEGSWREGEQVPKDCRGSAGWGLLRRLRPPRNDLRNECRRWVQFSLRASLYASSRCMVLPPPPAPAPRPGQGFGVLGRALCARPKTPSQGSPSPPQWEGGRGDGSHTCPGRWSLACPQNELDPGDSPVDKSRTLRYNAYRLVCHTNQSRTCSHSRSERSGERSTGMDRIHRMMPPYPVHPVYPCSSPSCRRSAPESRRGRADAWVLYTRV